MIDIYGTIGPSCSRESTLQEMFEAGMTGMRVNLSHMSLQEAIPGIQMIQQAGKRAGCDPKILIDLQGPELRIGHLPFPLQLQEGTCISLVGESVWNLSAASDGQETKAALCRDQIPLPEHILEALTDQTEVLLDDGKLLLRIVGRNSGKSAEALVLRGGRLSGRKSIALCGKTVEMPAMTLQDRENIRMAASCGVTGVMQPFVRSAEDLREVRKELDEAGGKKIRLFAKIENLSGVGNLESFFPVADEIVIARGDLGNALPLWELPGLQKKIAAACRKAGVPFMTVTQMLSSMEKSKVPTRAEVCDIYNAVLDGSSSVMVTGETAIGEYPVEVIRYLARTAAEGEKGRMETCR